MTGAPPISAEEEKEYTFTQSEALLESILGECTSIKGLPFKAKSNIKTIRNGTGRVRTLGGNNNKENNSDNIPVGTGGAEIMQHVFFRDGAKETRPTL